MAVQRRRRTAPPADGRRPKGRSIQRSHGIGAIVLAAGASTRMGRPKALLPLPGGESFLGAIAATLAQVGIARGDILVVTGSSKAAIEAEAHGLSLSPIFNRRHSEGQHASARTGLRRAIRLGWRGALLWPCDMPFVGVETLRQLLRAPWPAVPGSGAKTGHPLALDRASILQLLREPPLGTLREALRAAGVVPRRVLVADPGAFLNLNTPAAYLRHTGLMVQAKSRSRRPVISS